MRTIRKAPASRVPRIGVVLLVAALGLSAVAHAAADTNESKAHETSVCGAITSEHTEGAAP